MSFTRKMFRILTKRILTCLFKKGGGYSAFWFKIAQKLPKKCSFSERLLEVAQNPKSC